VTFDPATALGPKRSNFALVTTSSGCDLLECTVRRRGVPGRASHRRTDQRDVSAEAGWLLSNAALEFSVARRRENPSDLRFRPWRENRTTSFVPGAGCFDRTMNIKREEWADKAPCLPSRSRLLMPLLVY